MPDVFKIEGGAFLGGEIAISGSKNSALPFIAAALLTEDEVVFSRVPEITDVEAVLSLLEALGASVSWDRAAKTVSIKAGVLKTHVLEGSLSRKLRGSFLFSGPMLSRLKRAELPYPGGDAIGARPLSTHLAALRKLGVRIDENGTIVLDGSEMKAGIVILEEPSVTATENTILASVLLGGITEIHLAAQEPHVQELVLLLNAMGAKIRWKSVGVLEIEGVRRLHGVEFEINPDEIEISSFAALAAATHSELLLRGIRRVYLDATLLQLEKMGVEYRVLQNDLVIEKPKRPYKGFRLQSGLYPKLLSDQIPPFSVLATQAAGETLIHEWMYEGRLRYLDELMKMGASATILDPHRALILGPTPLHGREVSSLDVRSGMTLIIAALVADGESTLQDVHHIDRGYERIDERLRGIGAKIERLAV